ncbi:MAG: hypothetical protein Q9M30_02605, partial [Mariprofundaceae bacterium]|nr:hypothetical protein [Mariprofundaceae bacterium]
MLAACRRVLLAGLAVLVVMGSWMYWQAPSLNELRPEVEEILARQFGLKSLHLGHLSWRWAGHIWLKAENLTFAGSEQRIRVENAQLELRLSSWELMRGMVRPTSIRLRHGRIELHIPKAASGEVFPVPAGQLHIEDSNVVLTYGSFSNRFEQLDMHLDADRRTLAMQMPGFTLDVAWNSQLQPEHVHAEFNNLNWLPAAWRMPVRGEFSTRLRIDKVKNLPHWQLSADIASEDGVALLGKGAGTLFALNDAHLKAVLHAGDNPLDITKIDLQDLSWAMDEDSISAQGGWTDGQLQLSLSSEGLQLGRLVKWAMPMAGEDLRTWLAGVDGRASGAQVEVLLPQASPWSIPDMAALLNGGLQLQARVQDVSIPLAAPDEFLTGADGDLSFDARGLHLEVSNMHLPHDAGEVTGSLNIRDIARPVLEIDGSGKVDVGLCEHWLNTGRLPQLVWKASPARARFTLSWPLPEGMPDKGDVELTPLPEWQLELMQQAVRLHGGSMRWQAGGGLQFKGMGISYEDMQGDFDLQVKETSGGSWELMGLRLKSSGDFSAVAGRYRMPVDGAVGRYAFNARFDPAGTTPWHLAVDMKDAAWERLLGSAKKTGTPYVLKLSARQGKDVLHISRIQSKGGAPYVTGNGSLSRQKGLLNITALQAPAFSGAVSIVIPFVGKGADKAPLEINVNSDFFDQAALPRHIPEVKILPGISVGKTARREWVLRGQFSRIRWDAVSIRGVRVHFASSTQGVGRLEADALDAAKLSIRDVKAVFRLSSGDHVDIRHLGAHLLGQDLDLSGT